MCVMHVSMSDVSFCFQLSYSEMLNRVDPLRREMSSLENEAEVTRMKGEEINKIIQGLETSISRYKEEYAVLISQVNSIKADLVTVEAKVFTPCILGGGGGGVHCLLEGPVYVCAVLFLSQGNRVLCILKTFGL